MDRVELLPRNPLSNGSAAHVIRVLRISGSLYFNFRIEFSGSVQNSECYAGTTEANFRASTRLNAPINRVSSPSVDANTGAEGKSLQIVLAERVFRSSSAIRGHARAMSPARFTASGLSPLV